MMRKTVNFLDSFARRMLVMSVVTCLVFGLSLPLVYYQLSLRDREQNNTLRARLMADKVAEAVRDNEELWFYDVPRFIELSHRLLGGWHAARGRAWRCLRATASQW